METITVTEGDYESLALVTKDVIHHSDRGVQYLSIRYTDKMADCGVIASVGITGASYDHALAETVNGLFKAIKLQQLVF